MGKRELKTERKKILILILAFNVGLLLFFKYLEFFNESLRYFLGHFQLSYPIPLFRFLVPIGISFYVFKSLSYTIDIYRGDMKPERHLGFFALYVSFFPQLLAGPIERATRFMPKLYQKFNLNEERVTHGLRRMLWGFFQKMVIWLPTPNLPLRGKSDGSLINMGFGSKTQVFKNIKLSLSVNPILPGSV